MKSIVAATLIGVLALSSCTSETRDVGPGEIRFPTYKERFEDVALFKVFVNGENVGRLRKSRLIDDDSNDANDRFQYWVENGRGEKVGFITDELKGYRFRAHEAPEFVSNHPSLENNVRVVMGYASGAVTFEKLVAAD